LFTFKALFDVAYNFIVVLNDALTDATSGAGTAYPSGEPAFNSGFW